MNQTQVAKLLNRTLTSSEVTNFDLYLKIAYERLRQLVCFSLCDIGGTRTYNCRKGYYDLFIDPFTSIESVTIDGSITTAYIIKQNELYNADWYNVVEFDEKMVGDRVTINATWGFVTIPYDLQLFIAKLFSYISIEQKADDNIKSKKIEDFTVTYKDGATYDEFITANQSVINKYSQCNIGLIDHGYVQPICQ